MNAKGLAYFLITVRFAKLSYFAIYLPCAGWILTVRTCRLFAFKKTAFCTGRQIRIYGFRDSPYSRLHADAFIIAYTAIEKPTCGHQINCCYTNQGNRQQQSVLVAEDKHWNITDKPKRDYRKQ